MENQQTTPPPQTPVDIQKTVRVGWIVFGVAILVTAVGLYFGYALAASALIAAFAGRLGLQAKNKPLAITALTFCGLALLYFLISIIANQ